MIQKFRDYIKLDTPDTTLLFRVRREYTEILYYGRRLPDAEDYDVFGKELYLGTVGCEDYVTARLPVSFTGMGNGTESFLIVKNADGSYVNRFEYAGAAIEEAAEDDPAFPHARNKAETLVLKYTDKYAALNLELRYSVFSDSDVISVKSRVEYTGAASVEILRCMSLQADFWGDDFGISTFDGVWAKERCLHTRKIGAGVFVNDSKIGGSSNRHNPFFLLEDTRGAGKTYAFNLIYSGNHKEIVEVTSDGRTHVLAGVNDYLFNYRLRGGEKFDSPEAVMLFADSADDATRKMHGFVRKHILPPEFAEKQRPVLLNNWEATYFDFDLEKLTKLMEKAKEAGMELFVLDDGWFGDRNDDSSALGDWLIENPKVKGGIAGFAAAVRKAGLKFGIWMEPEMVSQNSELFRSHPEYAMANHRPPLTRRNQLMLDLTNPEVCEYVTKAVSGVIEKYDVDYIKWDYNRNMIDMFGREIDNQGEYFYRYICGLYKILSTIRASYPHVLFESCASGGNRFDLGILYFMPQIWASDNTDAYDRLFIQEGTLYAYPQNTMGAHVSACPNHQTGNSVSIENRFNVAAFGLLGYELDLTALSESEFAAVKAQVAYYKAHRTLLQGGRYYRLDSAFCGNYAGGMIVSEDKSEAMAFVAVKHKITGRLGYRFFLAGLEEKKKYAVEVRSQCNVKKAASFTAFGSALMSGDVSFGDLFGESDRAANSASLASRIVYLKEIN